MALLPSHQLAHIIEVISNDRLHISIFPSDCAWLSHHSHGKMGASCMEKMRQARGVGVDHGVALPILFTNPSRAAQKQTKP